MVTTTLVRKTSGRKLSRLRERAERLAGIENEYLFNADFRKPRAEAAILDRCDWEQEVTRSNWKPGKELPAHLVQMCERKLLTQEEETGYFRRMNFAKYRADVLRRKLDPSKPDRKLVERIEELLARGIADRNEIVRANLRLVVSIARKFADEKNTFDELLSEGIETLVRAVEKFDYSRGFRFSTYATMAVRRQLCRSVKTAHRDRNRYHTGDEALLDRPREESEPLISEQRFHELRSSLSRMLGRLDPREREIVRRRFGLGDAADVQTLQSLAGEMGVCKERVRQLELRAIAKLRTMAEESRLKMPDEDL